MVTKEFTYKGKTLEELQGMSIEELATLYPARARRSLKRGLTLMQKRFIEKIKIKEQRGDKKPLRTHLRDMIVLPIMVGKSIHVHNGKEYAQILILPDMLGLRLGDLAMTRKRVEHSAPGIGATRSSSALSVK